MYRQNNNYDYNHFGNYNLMELNAFGMLRQNFPETNDPYIHLQNPLFQKRKNNKLEKKSSIFII